MNRRSTHRLAQRWIAGAAATLAMGTAAAAPITADIVWVIDTSGSMGGDIAQVKARITEFEAVMLNAGVDARYAAVRFGGAASLIQDLTTAADFSRAGGPFALLGATGGSNEDGSEALRLAINNASWRTDAVRNLILVTDEDDDNVPNRAALQTTLDGTTPGELINVIGNPGNDSNNYYRNLAAANRGNFFDILAFRSNPGPFFTNFVNTKLGEIVIDFCTRFPNDPRCQNTVPEPSSYGLAALALVALAATRRRTSSPRRRD